MTLDIATQLDGSSFLLRFNGTLDYTTIDGFDPELPEDITKVIVDFSGLDFIDSTGIGAVLSIIFKSGERGIFVEFSGLNAEVTELFETIGVFEIKKSLLHKEEA